MSAKVDLVAHTLLPFSRWRDVANRLAAGESPADVLDRHCHSPARAARGSRRIDSTRLRALAHAALERAAAARLRAIFRTALEYPPALQHIADPPPVLWVRGDPQLLARLSVAIVGSRAGSPYALQVAERLGADLASRGVTVVSGMARGVDSSAHEGALSAGGVTNAVLGSGADVVYPAEHRSLAMRIAANGAIVSELVPGTRPRPEFFPRRNRIISGLVRAVVVVEAGEKSGSLITARCALDQGRDVLAVPGNILSGRNTGGHALLRDGARLVETADDIVEELGLNRSGAAPPTGDTSDPVLAVLAPGEPAELGQISLNSGLSAAVLLPRLLDLELRGLVRRVAGGRFLRVGKSC
jgi:DNA processing protein